MLRNSDRRGEITPQYAIVARSNNNITCENGVAKWRGRTQVVMYLPRRGDVNSRELGANSDDAHNSQCAGELTAGSARARATKPIASRDRRLLVAAVTRRWADSRLFSLYFLFLNKWRK